MSGRFQGKQTTLRWAEQLEQMHIARRVLAKRAGTTQHLTLLTHHSHHVTLRSDVNSCKPHQPSSFHDSIPRASEPELTLLLVHSRTPLAPLDTVRALSPGRGRQSSAQGFTFSTAGGDTSPGNLSHLSRCHSLVGSPRSASLAREKSPGLPPQIVAASHLGFLTPPPPPPHFFLGLPIR